MALTRRERTDRTLQELIDELEVHLDEEEYEWCTEIAFDIGQIGFKNQDLEKSRRFIDEVAKPIGQYYHASELVNSKGKGSNGYQVNVPVRQDFDPQYWMEELGEWKGKNHGNHISPKSSSITELRDRFERDTELDIDIICGVATGGIAPAASINDLFEETILDYPRFSPYRENDKEVEPDLDRDFSGLDVLIVDDIVESGQTFRKMAQYYLENGAEDIYLTAARIKKNKWNLFESGEVYKV
jgi:phosphoribosylpyrophosphate synthetase